MAEVINMPRLSDTMEEGTLAKWFKKVGDDVKEGEILAEIETDKATMEFESFHDGVLLHIGIDEGSTAPVDSIIAVIGSKGEDISSLIKGDSTPEVKEEPKVEVKEEPKVEVKEELKVEVKQEPEPITHDQPKFDSNGRILISTLAKKLASEK
jgi:pyruvate dehydrogenase E2 component (dihydrolipoamide acetyltransferase)